MINCMSKIKLSDIKRNNNHYTWYYGKKTTVFVCLYANFILSLLTIDPFTLVYNVLADMNFGLPRKFYVEFSNIHKTCSWTSYLICFFYSLNLDQARVLSYCKYSLLFLPVVGIEPVTARWFHSETLSNQRLSTVPCVFPGEFIVHFWDL